MALTAQLPSRSEAERLAGSVPQPGGTKPAIWSFHKDARHWLVKDVRYTHPGYRFTLGRLLLRREAAHYARLQELPFVPRTLGLLDADALVLEQIDAPSLGDLRRPSLDPGLPGRLWSCIAQLHARGVVHLDLRTRRNILVTSAGNLVLLDFANAIDLGSHPWLRKALFPLLSAIDRSAVLKLIERDFPDQMSSAERNWQRQYRILRWMWPFTRLSQLLSGARRSWRSRRAAQATHAEVHGPSVR